MALIGSQTRGGRLGFTMLYRIGAGVRGLRASLRPAVTWAQALSPASGMSSEQARLRCPHERRLCEQRNP